MSPSRFAAQHLVEAKAVDLATVSALPTTTLGTSAVLAQQVSKRLLPEHLADLVEAKLEHVRTAVPRLREPHQAPFASG